MALVRKPPRGFPAIVTGQKPDQPSLTNEQLPSEKGKPTLDDSQIVTILEGYREEAEYARLAGPNSRDLTWLQHLDLYYNRYDMSKKAAWQAREVLPEFPQYVDRFAAAMRMALVAQPNFFNVTVDNDQEGDIARNIRKFMNVILRRIGRTPSGHRCDFSATFEEMMKMGALSLPIAGVTYKDDGEVGYCAVDIEDPYNYWFDPTGRNLYRIRRVEMDLHELRALMDLEDKDGDPLFNHIAIEACYNASMQSTNALMTAEREKRTGTGQWMFSNRRPVILHEYYCTLVDSQGYVHGKNVLCVVANNRFLLRGPEKNPFWHGKDWYVAAPIITVPMAPYGRAYAENFSSITRTFNEMTNLILDGVFASAMKVFTVIPGYLEDPQQLEDGIYPNAMFRMIEGLGKPDEFMTAIEMGTLDPAAIQIWQMLKKELQEGAAFNDMTLGNSAPKGRTSATEINTVDTNATSYMRSIANNVETLMLEPLLDLIWKTSLQHLNKNDLELQQAVGEEWFAMFYAMKKKLAEYKVTFVCRGITDLLARKQKLQEWLQFLQVATANPQFSAIMTQEYSPQKLFDYTAMLMDIDIDQLTMSPREQMMAQLKQQQTMATQQQAQAQQTQQEGEEDFKKKARSKVLDHLLSRQPPPASMQSPQMQPGPGGQQPVPQPAIGGPPSGSRT